MNAGFLIDTFVLAYGILSIMVSTDICLFLIASFYCPSDPHSVFRLCIRTLTSIKEKAVIQRSIIPGAPLICTEAPPHLDLSAAGSDGFPRDIVSRTLPLIRVQVLNWFYGT